MPVVGTSVNRKDAPEKAEGRALYIADILLPNMLHAAVLRSPHPHAKIISINPLTAKKLAGIRAVLTAKDIPGKNLVHIVFNDMPLLASDRVRYVGEPVALVAAEEEWIAWRSLTKIKVKYQQLPALLDFKEARSAKLPHLYKSNNTFSHHHIYRGDVVTGAKTSAAIVEGTFETPYQEHAYVEPQGMLAIPKPNGSIEVLGSMQCPFYVQEAVADVCGLPRSKIIIKQTETGGAFGGKEDVPSIVAGHVALLAYKTQCPVRIIYRRDEDFISMSKRHPSQVTMKIGCNKEGKLTFIEATILLNGGAYATLSPVVLWRSIIHATGAYVCPNIKIDGYVVATNQVPCGAFRGFGSPQSLFAIESLIDELAIKIGMDPIAFREINLLQESKPTGTGQLIIGSCGLRETLSLVKKACNWSQRKNEFKKNNEPVKRGLGLSTIFYGVGLGAGGKHLARTGAFLQIAVDGSVQLAVGTTELGQGMRTVLAQIAADGLGVSYDDIYWIDTDTSRVPDSGPTVASRATTMSGLAILNACNQAKKIMGKIAAEILKSPNELLQFKDGICSSQNNNAKITIKELITECHKQRLPMAFQGFAVSPDTEWNANSGSGRPYVVYAYATNIAQVAIDIRTGEIAVEKIWAAHDVGNAVNPLAVEGQIEGGVVQGIGFSLMEGYYLNQGKPVNPDLTFYLIPCSTDIPEIEPMIIEHKYDKGPFGVKGFGEQPLMGIAPAITNAIRDAIGIRFYKLPVTPEIVWLSINKGNN